MQNKCKTMFESVEYTSNYDILINAKSIVKNWLYLNNSNKKANFYASTFIDVFRPLRCQY